MGESADMMLGGELCAQCGVAFSMEYYDKIGDAEFPVCCDDCKADGSLYTSESELLGYKKPR